MQIPYYFLCRAKYNIKMIKAKSDEKRVKKTKKHERQNENKNWKRKRRWWGFLASEVIKAEPTQKPLHCCCLLLLHATISNGFTAHVPSLANTGTLSASWVSLPPCQAALLSLHVSVSFSPPLSATHLGLVIHDSWSRVSKFNLRCVKTQHIYKLCAERLPMRIVLNLFLLSNMCKISNA